MAKALVKSGEADDIGTALDQIAPKHPDLWRRHRTESLPKTAAKATDPNQRPPADAGAHLDEISAPVTAPEPTSAHIAYDALVQQMRNRNPHLTIEEIRRLVDASPEGQRAWAKHRLEHYQRVGG